MPELFEATHRLILGMVERGQVQGLRIDHIDGLFDPARYCATLRERAGEQTYIVAEKILARYERLPDWPIAGTTGYDFVNQVLGIFIDAGGEAAMTRLYRRITGHREDFDEVLYGAKQRIMHVNLASEMNVLARRFHRLSMRDWRTRDFTLRGMLTALEEVIAAFPVYRTYVSDAGAGPDDHRYIDWAVGLAKKRWATEDTTILDFIHGVLIADLPGHPLSEDVLRTAMQFQQVTGPVMAKAFEDTAFYRYFRLLALNEVGGDPRRFGMSCAAFHHVAAERGQSWPRAMLTTATHDTKRGEDARLRIALLSEMPREWGRRVAGWIRLNRRHRGEIDGEDVPDRNIEYLFYQMLVGVWPPAARSGRCRGRVGSGRAGRRGDGQVGARRQAAVELELPERGLRGRVDAVRARRARCRQTQSVSGRFRRFCRTARAPGGDRVAGAARAEADNPRRAGHLSGRRAVGFQPRRSGQPPARRLERTAPPAGQAVRREPRRPGRALAGRAGKTVRDGAAARFAPDPAGAVRRTAITSRSRSARAAIRIASAPFPAGTVTRCWQSPCRG